MYGGVCQRSQTRVCSTSGCTTPGNLGPPQHCVVSDWYDMIPSTGGDPCSKLCDDGSGGGTKTQRRHVEVSAANGGSCNYNLEQQVACNTHVCPVNCVGEFVPDGTPTTRDRCCCRKQVTPMKYVITRDRVGTGDACPHANNSLHNFVQPNPDCWCALTLTHCRPPGVAFRDWHRGQCRLSCGLHTSPTTRTREDRT